MQVQRVPLAVSSHLQADHMKWAKVHTRLCAPLCDGRVVHAMFVVCTPAQVVTSCRAERAPGNNVTVRRPLLTPTTPFPRCVFCVRGHAWCAVLLVACLSGMCAECTPSVDHRTWAWLELRRACTPRGSTGTTRADVAQRGKGYSSVVEDCRVECGITSSQSKTTRDGEAMLVATVVQSHLVP